MLLNLRDICYFLPDGRLLLADVNMTVDYKSRIGIVGRNGSGKSTLLNILGKQLEPSAGDYTIANGVRVLIVRQDLPSTDITPLEYLRSVDEDLKELDDKSSILMDENNFDSEFNDIQERITQLEVERYETLAPQVLSGLGLTKNQQSSPMKNLSGGMRMRIGLASALVQQPDVLILDEPTNHLDLESVLWFVEFMKTYQKSYIIVSHDRNILRDLTNTTYHIQSGRLTRYGGNYDLFTEEYKLKREQAIFNNEKTDKRNEDLQVFINKFKSNPKWAKIAHTREKFIEKNNAARLELIQEEPPIPIVFPECIKLGDPIFEIENGSATYKGTNEEVLKKLNLSILHNSRIGLLGRNGQGKSTLVRLIVDDPKVECRTNNCKIMRAPKLKIGYFSQEQTDILNVDFTVYEQYKDAAAQLKDDEIRSRLANFGFSSKKIDTKIENLSGGEKSRLLFAIISAKNPNLVIMDEPTNHLDIEARDALIKAINEFPGAVILVSHDWQLMEATMQNFWLVNKGTAIPFNKGLGYYKKSLMDLSKPQTGYLSDNNNNNQSNQKQQNSNSDKKKQPSNGTDKKPEPKSNRFVK